MRHLAVLTECRVTSIVRRLRVIRQVIKETTLHRLLVAVTALFPPNFHPRLKFSFLPPQPLNTPTLRANIHLTPLVSKELLVEIDRLIRF